MGASRQGLTPTSSSSPVHNHDPLFISPPVPVSHYPRHHTRLLSLSSSPILESEDITNILHPDAGSAAQLDLRAVTLQHIQLFSPIPCDSKIICRPPPLGPWILKTYWYMESYCLGSPISIIQAKLSAVGATQRLIIDIDAALKPTKSSSVSNSILLSFSFFRSTTMSAPRVSATDAVQRINLHLLRCATLLACEQPNLGLKDANRALVLSETERIYHLRSKSHLYRGLCFRKLARWAEASSAFTRAANIRSWASRVRELKSEAEDNITPVEAEQLRKVRFADL